MVWKRFRETEEKGAAAAAAAAAPANFILARACSAAEQPVAEPDSLRNAHALARARAIPKFTRDVQPACPVGWRKAMVNRSSLIIEPTQGRRSYRRVLALPRILNPERLAEWPVGGGRGPQGASCRHLRALARRAEFPLPGNFPLFEKLAATRTKVARLSRDTRYFEFPQQVARILSISRFRRVSTIRCSIVCRCAPIDISRDVTPPCGVVLYRFAACCIILSFYFPRLAFSPPPPRVATYRDIWRAG